jgi:uncharacterized protein (TIGR02246 family)
MKAEQAWRATKGVKTVTGRLPLCCLLALASMGSVSGRAAGRSSEDAEQITKEIIRLDEEKVHALNTNDAAWFERVYADDISITGVGYGGLVDKANVVDGFRSKAHQLHTGSVHHDNRRVHVYNGDTAVLTYIGNGVAKVNGKTSTVHTWTTDVYVKQDGAWREVVHHVTGIPAGMKP